ncbi:RagB/SusD family nutrient uptake outer membrane protein [Prolixibacteraceae bacterium]|nr:RagB/SusD family nutrient uptake outer membrane protein [Prolixibacteraceae bacterium]
MFKVTKYKRLSLSFLLGALLLMTSCDYLDFDESNRLYDEESVFSNFGQTSNLLNHLYSYVQQDFGVIGSGAMRDCASDDAEFANPNNPVQDMNNGNWSALNVKDDVFEKLYQGIRAANNFIAHFDPKAYDGYKNNSAYLKWKNAFQYYPYEARALRAYMYFELAKRYGNIPLTTDVLTIEQANSIGKAPFNDVIAFITKECDEIYNHLPVSYLDTKNKETGRVTKGFVMALKSRALLYAASPLHNKDNNKEKWEDAAKASLALIDSVKSKGWYTKESGANAVNNFASKEAILFKNNKNSNKFEQYNFPVRFTSGATSITGVCPTQNLVDAFQTKNGFDVTLTESGWVCDDPEFDANAPYQNRDPRFYQTILYDGEDFKGQTIETFVGGQDYGPVTSGGSATGYFLKKYIIEDTNFAPDNKVTAPHFYVVFRYGEILLNYAEAMMGAFNDPDYKDGTFTLSAREAVNEVRGAVPMPAITEASAELFNNLLRNERRVELAFEDHRFWDIRRWDIGDATQKDIYAVQIVDNAGEKTYKKFKYETRSWSDKMNLYPIKQQELFRNTNLEPQNTGW